MLLNGVGAAVETGTLYTTSLQRSRSSILPHLTFPAHQPDSAPVADSIRASQLVQDGDVRILEPCGHRLVPDCPTEFVHAVNQFLDAV
jgi:hypothetical protein